MKHSSTKSIVSKGRMLQFDQPKVMGILNATPDSFYTGQLENSLPVWQSRIDNMVNEGAAIIDIGGISTKPFSKEITLTTELQRVLPVIEWTRQHYKDIFISIDTYRSEVASAAIKAGADIINDISGGQFDPKIWDIAIQHQVPYIGMHIQGTPETMQINPTYDDVTLEVIDCFITLTKQLRAKGLHDLIIDPGFGFGKTIEHNFQLLKQLQDFQVLDAPILVGVSRKGMISKTVNRTSANALAGTIAANVLALQNGASILRVHDVAEATDAIKIVRAYDIA